MTFDDLTANISLINAHNVYGLVRAVRGLVVEIAGPQELISVGNRIALSVEGQRDVITEIVGFSQDNGIALSFGSLDGVRPGCRARLHSRGGMVAPSDNWKGRVINGHGKPIDERVDLGVGVHEVALKGRAIAPHLRGRVGGPMSLGVRAVDSFITCCQGQRLGIFAGSGVGKSVLLSMLAKHADVDTIVIGLIGERGREVKEFIEDQLGDEGIKRAVIVVATSDEPALMRRDAAYMTLSVAEYFRSRGEQVLCMMDSVTRFAMALREIGLSTGEPPTTKGYPPSVFSELPKLLERAGPGVEGEGAISGLFTVLVDGDDHNEPIADAIRGILDGHIVMERAIAERGRFPAINVLKSVSRMMPGCVEEEYRETLKQARAYLARYGDMEELIRLGAYRKGTDEEVDMAIEMVPRIEAFLAQQPGDFVSREDALKKLQDILTNSGLN